MLQFLLNLIECEEMINIYTNVAKSLKIMQNIEKNKLNMFNCFQSLELSPNADKSKTNI